MDKVIHPHMRKWISEPIPLGEAAARLRTQAKALEQITSAMAAAASHPKKEENQKHLMPATTSKKNSEKSSVRLSTGSKGDPVPSTSKAAAAVGGSTGKKSSRSYSIGAVPKPITEEQKQENLRRAAYVVDTLTGDKFFDVKTVDKTKKKRGRNSTMFEEDNTLAEDLAKTLAAADITDNDDDDSDDPKSGVRVPSVRDYFSDFSNLSDDSEDEYDDFDDFLHAQRVSSFQSRAQKKYGLRRESDSDDSDEEEDEEDMSDEENKTAKDADEMDKVPRERYEPNEEIDEGDYERKEEGPSTSKRARFEAGDQQQAGPSTRKNDEEINDNPQPSGSKDQADERTSTTTNVTMKERNNEEQFLNFMDRVFKIQNKRDTVFQEENVDKICEEMQISKEKFNQLRDTANISLVSVKGETFQEEAVVECSVMPVLAPPLPESAKATLQSLAIFVTHGDDPTGFQWRSNNVQQQINDDIFNVDFQKRMVQQEKDYANKEMLPSLVNKEEDFLIEMSVYQAGDPDDALPDDVKSYSEPKLGYKLKLLGRQTLAELRDAMHCENDLMSLSEVEHPDELEEGKTKFANSQYTASALIIGDCVYSDMRTPGAINFAPLINKWAETPPVKNIGPFKEGDLMNTKLEDLTIRFGYPYLYMHMGSCEHIIVFNQARLLEMKDEHRLNRYPVLIPSPNFKSIYCRVDNEYLAKWAVLDYEDFPEDPMMVCTECLKMYCYDKFGKKHGNFQLFPFYQLSSQI